MTMTDVCFLVPLVFLLVRLSIVVSKFRVYARWKPGQLLHICVGTYSGDVSIGIPCRQTLTSGFLCSILILIARLAHL